MTDLSKIFTVIGSPDPETSKRVRPSRMDHPKVKSRDLTTNIIHTLSREAFLIRKAELEAQYPLFPKTRLESLNPDCIIPLVIS